MSKINTTDQRKEIDTVIGNILTNLNSFYEFLEILLLPKFLFFCLEIENYNEVYNYIHQYAIIIYTSKMIRLLRNSIMYIDGSIETQK